MSKDSKKEVILNKLMAGPKGTYQPGSRILLVAALAEHLVETAQARFVDVETTNAPVLDDKAKADAEKLAAEEKAKADAEKLAAEEKAKADAAAKAKAAAQKGK